MQNLLRAIEARRTIALDRFIYALGIRRVGETNAKLLARHYGSFANWRAQMLAATTVGSEERSALGSIIGVGPALAEELAEFFAEPRNRAALDELAAELDDRGRGRRRSRRQRARRQDRGVHRHAGDHDPAGSQGPRRSAGRPGDRQRQQAHRPRRARRRRRLEGQEGGRARASGPSPKRSGGDAGRD